MAKTYSVEEAANAIMDMSSSSEFDESSDAVESVSEDSSWYEALPISKIAENKHIGISSSAVTLTRKTPLHGIRGRSRGQIRIRGGRMSLNSIRVAQSAIGTDTSDTENSSKDTDSDTDNNNKNLNDNIIRRQKQRKRKREASKNKSNSRFGREETPKDLELFEFSENSGITQDMSHIDRPFDFFKLFLTEQFFQTVVNKKNEYAEKVTAISR